jgi:hypothetical protein
MEELPETFQLILSNPTGATIVDDTGVATIIDDDSNNDPVAVDDAATAESEVEQIIDVLANDSDPDGDSVVIDSVESPTPGGGTVVINPDNTLSYTSAPSFTGTDTFSYTVSDGQGGTATATVSIDVTGSSTSVMFVADISFQSRRGGKDWRAIFEVRDENGAAVSGATIEVTFNGQTFTGQSDSAGQFRTSWQRNLSSGSYQAEVVDLALLDYTWDTNQGSGDSDGDGLPDDVLLI